jgi:hypothetical protein
VLPTIPGKYPYPATRAFTLTALWTPIPHLSSTRSATKLMGLRLSQVLRFVLGNKYVELYRTYLLSAYVNINIACPCQCGIFPRSTRSIQITQCVYIPPGIRRYLATSMLKFVEGSYYHDLRQTSIKGFLVEEYSGGRVHKFSQSVTQTHSQYQFGQYDAHRYSQPSDYRQVR